MNMNQQSTQQEQFVHYTHVIVNEQGRIVEVPLRRGVEDAAFIDQISFTFHEATLQNLSYKPLLNEIDYMTVMSSQLAEIFGFGIWKKAKTSGNRFYEHCYLLGTEEVLYGKVYFGGESQKESVLVEITASGCKAALTGWESRLKPFLDNAEKARITRADLTIDDIEGKLFNLDDMEQEYLNGGFSWTNRRPKMNKVGTDWHAYDQNGNQLFETGSGKTLYIGSRNCAKYVRIYEKGKQLGDKNSPWVRFEIEFRNRDILITTDILTEPGKYFGGAYPICARFTQKADRLKSHLAQIDKTVEKVKDWAKTAFGGVWNMYKQYFPNMTEQQIWAELEPDHDRLPKGLCPAAVMVELDTTEYLHQKETEDDKLMHKFDADYDRAIEEKASREAEQLEREEAALWAAYQRSKNRLKSSTIPFGQAYDNFTKNIDELAKTANCQWANVF